MTVWYPVIGFFVAAYCMWLILWKDAMETRKAKRKSVNLEKVTLGNLITFIGFFLGMVVLWPMMALMSIGMTWTVFEWGDLVVYRKKPKPEPTVEDLEKKASKLGFSLTPKVIKGLDD